MRGRREAIAELLRVGAKPYGKGKAWVRAEGAAPPDEEEVECLVTLLNSVGERLDDGPLVVLVEDLRAAHLVVELRAQLVQLILVLGDEVVALSRVRGAELRLARG